MKPLANPPYNKIAEKGSDEEAVRALNRKGDEVNNSEETASNADNEMSVIESVFCRHEIY
jgi:hypothetical protein